MKQIRVLLAFVQLGRLHFLAGGVILHLLGVVIAVYSGAEFSVSALIWGQIAITSTQLMTHYANDYFDLEADRANLTPTNWSGGSRVLVQEMLPAQAALNAALILAGIALTANLILSIFIRPGAGTFALLFLGQFLAWFYSAPPIRLHSRGLGELTTAIVVPLLTPLTGYYLQAGKLAALPVLAVLPLCFIQFAMLLSIEFPDAEGDRQGGKHTLVVRFGASFTARLFFVSILAAYLVLPVLWLTGLPQTVVLAAALPFPLALWQLWRIHRADWCNPERWNKLAFYTIVLLVITATAELAAFLLLLGT